MTITTRAHGIDLSKYDLTFDPSRAVEQLDFVVQRASYGALDGRVYKDEGFDTLYPGVAQVEVRGAYHYLSSHSTWRAQADFFLSVIAGKGFHFFVCDFESLYNDMNTAFAKMAWDFIQYVQQQTGKPVFLYTNYYGYKDYIFPSEGVYGINWDIVPFWQAQYFNVINPDGTPSNPNGRTGGWQMWQYSRTGAGSSFGLGRPNVADLDVWNGTLSDMRTFLGLTGVLVPAVNPKAHVLFTDSQGRRFVGDVELKPE
jgi:GH25 family lysozyme M1 (1,4-beta-N-acetylmuramidase)